MRCGILALGLLAGCTLYDGRPSVDLEPHEMPVQRTGPVLTVRAAGGGRARLVVDGTELDLDVRVGIPLELPIGDLGDGPHRIRARLIDLAYAVESPERTFTLDRSGPEIRVDPPDGLLVRTTPLVVTVRVSDAHAGLETVTVTADPAGTVAQVDGSTWTVTYAGTLETRPFTDVQVAATDRLGNGSSASAHWYPPDLTVSMALPLLPAAARGPVAVEAWLQRPYGPLPAELQLLADGLPVARGPLVGERCSIAWDTASVPDGEHALTIGAPGWRVAARTFPFSTDNTPPRLLRCEAGGSGGLSVYGPFVAVYSEPALARGARLLPQGVELTSSLDGAFCLSVPVAVPSSLTLELPLLEDLAGNQGPGGSCTLDLPTWLSPLGHGPLTEAGGPMAAQAIAVRVVEGHTCFPPRPWQTVWIAASGATDAGALRSSDAGAPRNATAGSAAREVRIAADGLAWIEAVGSGAGQVYVSGPLGPLGPLNFDPSRDARDLAASPAGTTTAFAWSEATAAGGRTIWTAEAGGLWSFPGPATSNPAAIATEPAVSERTVAYVERAAPGAPGLLWVRPLGGDTLGGVPLNVDAGRSASSPVIAVYFGGITVAWIEGGLVYTRTWADGWGEAIPLTGDPADAPRSLRLASSVLREPRWLVAVLRGPSGDEIRAYRHDAGAWTPVAEPANAGVPGPVDWLEVQPGPILSVAWTDGAGNAYLRMYNE